MTGSQVRNASMLTVFRLISSSVVMLCNVIQKYAINVTYYRPKTARARYKVNKSVIINAENFSRIVQFKVNV